MSDVTMKLQNLIEQAWMDRGVPLPDDADDLMFVAAEAVRGLANPQLEQVRSLAFSARWADTVGTGHQLAARILNVLDGAR
jgi:hypothetical protein